MENNLSSTTTIKEKTNYQKMIDEEIYDANDPELVKMRKDARVIFREYNNLSEDELEKRTELLSKLFRKIDGNIKIEPPFYCDYGTNITVGKNFYMNFDCVILDCAKVEIGDNVMCAPKVQIYTAGHPTDPVSRVQGDEFAKKIKIGNNVWLGGGVIICPGVTIGDNTSIGAGSVVTKDIPNNVVAAGVPCKVIKKLE